MKKGKSDKVKKHLPASSKTLDLLEYPRTIKISKWLAIGIIALVPFHAFLTVFGASLGGNYTLLRLWSAAVLVGLIMIEAYWLWRNRELRHWLVQSYLMRVSGLYVVVQIVFAWRGIVVGQVSMNAAVIGLWLNIRYVIFFIVLILLCRFVKLSRETVIRVVIGTGLLVAIFAVLQYTVLPTDFLSHFGYNKSTIEPYETINNNKDYIRVISTTRGANPLGAYMLVVIMFIIAFWRKIGSKILATTLLSISVSALIFSFSRSAWIGLFVSFTMFIGLQLRTRRHWRHFGLVSLALVSVATATFVLFKHDPALQNALYHTEDKSTVSVSSNDQRAQAMSTAVSDILYEPLGTGVGSAGPASVHNSKGETRLAENYFLQIGQETGWFGLFSYISLLIIVGVQLWKQRRSTFSLVLLTLLVGISFINVLSHAWTDDTLAFTWWGLAGLAVGDWLWHREYKKLS